MRFRNVASFALLVAVLLPVHRAGAGEGMSVDLSPTTWKADYDRYMQAQLVDRSTAGVATGYNGAVTVAYNGLAARAGLEALKQGGNAIDALLTAAMAQVALTGGAPISYFGMMSLVYYDAETDRVYSMNAEWDTVRGEDDPMSIPGGIDMSTPDGIYGTAVSGRTALVGGFMKGVGAAHERFGKLPFDQLFEPSIYIAEEGMPISKKMAGYLEARAEDLARLPATREIYYKEDGTLYGAGEVLAQPALATTLRAIANEGTDYMYKGPWAERAVAAIRADGGKMTLEDLAAYEVIWDEPLTADFGEYRLYTNPLPNEGGIAMIEALNLAGEAGLVEGGHWTESSESLTKALNISQMMVSTFLPPATKMMMFPGIDFSYANRLTPEHSEALWSLLDDGRGTAAMWKPIEPKHSDDVVVVDRWGNIAAITQSINCVLWGKTAIIVDGITIGDPASFQQSLIAKTGPGKRLPSPTETGILFHQGKPVLGFASMGSGLHHRTFQALLNVMEFGMTVDDAIDTPDFFVPGTDTTTFRTWLRVPAGKYPVEVLEGTGWAYEEIDPAEARFNGEGLWVAISIDPVTGQLRAASHNRNNSDAVAF